MPKRSNKQVGDYESDGGFVEDAPKSKKQKKELSGGIQKDDDGNEYWEVRMLQSPAWAMSHIGAAFRQTPPAGQRVQGKCFCRSARVL